jgi:hypothetical protein
MPAWSRSVAAGTVAGALLAGIVWVFWQQDLRYSLPTPRPAGWRPPALATRIVLPPAIERLRARRAGQPILLHFFNPSCPCSRFNTGHVRELSTRFRDEVLVVAVLAEGDAATMRAAYSRLALDVPYFVDADRRLADALGVYSTPQAAIVDRDGRLAYVGNYNRTRYCRERDTEFARIALEAVVARRPQPLLAAAATTAYGCPLPARATAGAGL